MQTEITDSIKNNTFAYSNCSMQEQTQVPYFSALLTVMAWEGGSREARADREALAFTWREREHRLANYNGTSLIQTTLGQ